MRLWTNRGIVSARCQEVGKALCMEDCPLCELPVCGFLSEKADLPISTSSG